VLYEPLSFPLPDRPLYPQGFIDRLEALLKTGDREGVMTIFYREIAGMSAEEIERFRSSPAWQERVATAATLPRELRADERYRLDAGRFSAMHTPALLLVGGNSRDFEVNASKALAAALPNSQIAVLPGQEHIAIYTAPDLFLQAVLAFLSR
jgi:pimeloyl-ACP methyl ester carboxylesterase